MQTTTYVRLIAVGVLVAFVGVLIYLFAVSSEADETRWNRVIALYGGVEAIAFAATGFLFGKEINRDQVQRAEKRADVKEAEAAQARTEADTARTKGRTLAAAIDAKLQ